MLDDGRRTVDGGGFALPDHLCASGLSAADYSFTAVAGALTVTPASLTVTADNKTKTYGSANPALTYVIAGFLNGETDAVVTGTPACSTTAGTFSSVAGSPYPITCTQGTLASANYSFSFVAGALSVTPATLIAHPTVDNKAYDGNTTAVVSGGTLEGVLNSDDVTLDVSGALANFDTPAVGTDKPVHVTGLALSGPDAGNYVLASTEADTTASIGSAVLTVTADNQSRAYGAANPALTFQITGFLNGDDAGDLTTRPPVRRWPTASSSVAGSPYAITCSGAADETYAFSYVPGRSRSRRRR